LDGRKVKVRPGIIAAGNEELLIFDGQLRDRDGLNIGK
jgi:hypothetical protein